jgi:hypothetical protein
MRAEGYKSGNSNDTISLWLAHVAARKAKNEALMRAVESYELEFGKISEEELVLGMKQLDAETTPTNAHVPVRRQEGL